MDLIRNNILNHAIILILLFHFKFINLYIPNKYSKDVANKLITFNFLSNINNLLLKLNNIFFFFSFTKQGSNSSLAC